MATYTITLSDAQNKALGFVAYSQQEWIKNAICLHESICTLLFIFFLLHFYKRKSIDGTN